jgi:tetratricopeptide (TPR) repeat protein
LPSPPSDPLSQPLAGQVVVFSGKLSSLGRKDARALVERLGGITSDQVTLQTTLLVVGDETVAGAAEKTHHVKHAEELKGQGSAIRILAESEFCDLAGVPSPEVLRRQYHASRDLLARYPSLTDDQLRTLVKWGVIQPAARTSAGAHYDFAALSIIKQVHDEVSRGASFRSAVRALLASRQGQLSFDFRLDVEPAKILTLPRRQPPPSLALPDHGALKHDTALAEEYFKVGSALDNGDDAMKEQAATAYRRALELDPYLVAALINLANIHYGRDELVEAQALYERAIGLESDFFEAHFNLGNIYHDLNRFAEATACYEKALKLNPGYADAHFYLAVTLEKMGRSQVARPHWKTYQQLAPKGEWAELAREFSE